MEIIKENLEKRKEYLIQLKRQHIKKMKDIPKGRLRISSHGNRIQYYLRTDPTDFNGTYIREEDYHVARELAQEDYNNKALKAIDGELEAIEKYFKKYPKVNVEQVYEKMHIERRKLIEPMIEADEHFLNKWKGIKYQGKGISEEIAEFYTVNGERVRSKSEVMLADLLYREDVPYRYEYPLHLGGYGIIYPDFTVLNVKLRKEFYWEHFGMMDDPYYAEKAIQKIRTYEQNGYFAGRNLLLTFETRKSPINQKQIKSMIQYYLK